MERWKKITGFPNYDVSDRGRIRRDGVAKHPYDVGGYLQIALYCNTKCSKRYVHRLVGKAFIDNPNDLPQINHKDAVKSNNAAINLEWCTPAQNVAHAHRLRLRKTPDSPYVEEHTRMLKEGLPVGQIAKLIGGKLSTIRAIRDSIGIPTFTRNLDLNEDRIREIRSFRGTVRACGKAFGISKSSAHKIRAKECG